MSADDGPALVRLSYGAATDAGRIRCGNEDAAGADLSLGLFVVADGLGGHRAGEVASAVAVESLLASVRAAAGAAAEKRGDVLLEAVADAHEAVRAAAQQPGRNGMASTLVAAWISGLGCMWVVNVGDSRCYLLRDGRLAQLSVDHSALEDLRRAGLLPSNPADWPSRAELTQVLGVGTVTPHAGRHHLLPRDQILLCSDGLTGMLTDGEIGQVIERLPEPQAACDRLVQEANWRGGLDNTTVLVVDVLPGSPAHPESQVSG